VEAFVAVGAGFLAAVVWFDLMFDTQVLTHPEGDLPEPVLASIAAYYRRVTTDASPMNVLVALAMAWTVVWAVVEVIDGVEHQWIAWLSLALIVFAAGFGRFRTVPTAVRLGARTDPVTVQSELARRICREHLLFFAVLILLIGLQLGSGA
jgi:hypothetical protein